MLIKQHFVCSRKESNFHIQKGYKALNLARLPIPPRELRSSIEEILKKETTSFSQMFRKDKIYFKFC